MASTGGLKAIEYTRKKMEKLYAKDQIALRDIHSAYEALFLRSVVRFEAFLEELFVSILQGRVRYPAARGVSVKMKAINNDALMEILLQGDNYLDWLPIQKTIARAGIYLKDGRPFSDLDGGGRSTMVTITIIRNAIAHASPHALSQFQKIIGNRNLRPVEKSPAGFLRSPVTPGRTQFEAYVIELSQIATAIS